MKTVAITTMYAGMPTNKQDNRLDLPKIALYEKKNIPEVGPNALPKSNPENVQNC
jgi:hypothetical protein